jgi:hypothetical protein
MRISGFDDPDSSGWDALHQGTERESFDSPSKFDMSTLSEIMPRRKPAQPQSPPQPQPEPDGYTDPDTRVWASESSSWDAEPETEWETPAPEDVIEESAQSWAPPIDSPNPWTPPPDPATRWIPQAEPVGSPSVGYGWSEPGPLDDSWHAPVRPAPGYTSPIAEVPVASAGSRVRPYTRTGGRTRSDHNLALEALVSTSDDGRRYRGVRSIEHRRICDLCLDTRSVAEIAAHLRLPLGVVKVLIGDMADLGLVSIHQTELILGDRSSREFMERVLAGLRAL